MGLRPRASDLRKRFSTLANHLLFLVQWALYRVVLALEPLRERLPELGRDDDLWIFGARGGAAFADNAKYLYLHVAAEHPEVRPVWLSKDFGVVADLQSAGYEAYHCYSLRGLLLTLRAGVVCLTQGHRDLAMPATAGAFAVQLWHGVPLKRVSWDAEFRDDPRPVRRARADMADETDLLVVPGSELVETFSSGLRVDPDRMALAGYPRNDALFASIPGEEIATDAEALARVRDLAADGRLAIYLPTYRGSTDESAADPCDAGGFADHLDFAALDDFLAERDAVLAVKPHPKESFDPPDDCSRVVELPSATDPYPLVRHADALVTDYSSVSFDFLLLDRPVVFYPYDLDAYRTRRGFYFEYESVTPGPVARDFDELLAGLDRALARPEADAADRRALRDRLLDADPVTSGSLASGPLAPDSAAAESGARSASESGNRFTRSPSPRSAAVYEAIRDRLGDGE